jgi:hypothetical protein
MQITVTIDVDYFSEIQEYENKGTIQSLEDVEIEGLPECLEHEVDLLSRQGCWRTLSRLEKFIAGEDKEKIAYLCHLHEKNDSLEYCLDETEKVKLRKIASETFTHDGVTYAIEHRLF